MREREKERDQQLHNEQETNFRTMLLDLVRDPNMTWKEAKKVLRKDSRWDYVGDVLPRSERDEIFKEHMTTLVKKMRDFPQKSSDCGVSFTCIIFSWSQRRIENPNHKCLLVVYNRVVMGRSSVVMSLGLSYLVTN